MALLLAIAKWLAARLAVIVTVAVLITVAALLAQWWQREAAKRVTLDDLQAQAAAVQERFVEHRQQQRILERRLLELYQREPPIHHLVERALWKKQIEAGTLAVDAKNRTLRELRQQQQELTAAAAQLQGTINQTLVEFGRMMRARAGLIALAALVILAAPLAGSALWYFGIAPLADRAPPIVLDKPRERQGLEIRSAGKACLVRLVAGETLVARMAWVQQYTPRARKRTRWLWNWRAPFISYAAGLAELTEVTAADGPAGDEVVLTSTADPDTYLLELRLQDHPGLVIKPSQVVGVTGQLQLRTRWRLGNPHSWIAWKLRHIIVHGSGRLYLQGYGGVEPVRLSDQPVRIEEELVIGFETPLTLATVRTETFWPYYRGRTSLVDYEFRGAGAVLRQNALPPGGRSANPFLRFVDGIVNLIGKLLGL